MRRDAASDHRENDREAGSAEADSDEQAGAQGEVERALGARHEGDSKRVQDAARRHHPAGAVLVGDRAGERLRDAP